MPVRWAWKPILIGAAALRLDVAHRRPASGRTPRSRPAAAPRPLIGLRRVRQERFLARRVCLCASHCRSSRCSTGLRRGIGCRPSRFSAVCIRIDHAACKRQHSGGYPADRRRQQPEAEQGIGHHQRRQRHLARETRRASRRTVSTAIMWAIASARIWPATTAAACSFPDDRTRSRSSTGRRP